MRRFFGTKNNSRGRADPFGLLVLTVVLAVSLTILVQAQASSTSTAFKGPVTLWSPATLPLSP